MAEKPINLLVNVQNSPSVDRLLRSLQEGEATKERFQVKLLRKTLDNQQEQAAALARMLEGKGRVIDIRV
jgi:hypothetical protein